MRKDLQSFQKHNAEYVSESINSLEQNKEMLKRYKNEKLFEKLGFDLALTLTSKLPKTHIDIGSGTGWLVGEMSSRFEKSIGIEPSDAAINLAKQMLTERTNIEFLCMDMIDGMNHLNPTEPVFLTTSTVLNHIEDFYVRQFLARINTLPEGSILFFDERYDKNIQWNMWHVRSRDWWTENLKGWQLVFLNIENSGYPSGIYAIRRKAVDILPTKSMNATQSLSWTLSRIGHVSKRIINKVTRIILRRS